MSKLGKLVRDPRLFVVDSTAYRRWRRFRHRMVNANTSAVETWPLRISSNEVLAQVLFKKIAQVVAAADTSQPGQHSLGILHQDLHDFNMFLFELGKRNELVIFMKAANKELDINGALLLEIDRLVADVRFFEVSFQEKTGTAASICIELWDDDGLQYVGPRDNLDARRFSKKVAHEFGLFKKGNLTSIASLHLHSAPYDVDFPIDVVYTWVNHNDPDWQSLWESCFGEPAHAGDPEDKSSARFQNRDELRYSLRSLDLFAPWVRHVYIVSNCAPPSWMDLENVRLSWVSHEEILPANALPTFNSHAIEACLRKVPGLSEHFLYFNDDVFLLSPSVPGDFFFRTGMTKAFLEEYGSVSGAVDNDDPGYLNAARNGKRLIEEAFACSPRALHNHCAFALRVDVLNDIAEEFASAVTATIHSKLRSSSDISVLSFLSHHYGYLTGRTVPVPADSVLIKPSSRSYETTLLELLEGRKQTKMLCLNDGFCDSVKAAHWDLHVVEFLERFFPKPSSFEKFHGDPL